MQNNLQNACIMWLAWMAFIKNEPIFFWTLCLHYSACYGATELNPCLWNYIISVLYNMINMVNMMELLEYKLTCSGIYLSHVSLDTA